MHWTSIANISYVLILILSLIVILTTVSSSTSCKSRILGMHHKLVNTIKGVDSKESKQIDPPKVVNKSKQQLYPDAVAY